MNDLISRQAVIEIVENNHAHDITLIDGDAYTEGYRDGIKMKQSDILEDLAELPTVLFDSRDKDKKISLEDAEYAIAQLPSAQSFNKGLWVKQELAPQTLLFCSLCGCKKPQGVAGNFCPNCGADMRGSDDEYEETVRV